MGAIFMKISGVVSDLDGTLLDAEPLYEKATDLVLKEYGHSYTWDVAQTVIGRPEFTGASIIVSSYSLPLSPEEFLAKRDSHLLDLFVLTLDPLPGAVEAVAHLSIECKLPIAIATSSKQQYIHLKRARNEHLFSMFQDVVCGDDPSVLQGKPAPDIFLEGAKRIGIPPSECLAFEDSPAGCEAASRAGMTVIALAAEQMDPEKYKPWATEIIHNWSEFSPTKYGLPEFITKITKKE
eukprot:c5644_g1_i1.p1 GENE.c5644_g1_i1~~c5644_g1_i1.p1  ORF type:complete len:237 (-),score=43.22 c5644_g1_i1:131-841(-)